MPDDLIDGKSTLVQLRLDAVGQQVEQATWAIIIIYFQNNVDKISDTRPQMRINVAQNTLQQSA